MYWEKIEGWFNFDNIYSNMVNTANNGDIFVEIGTWKGKSTVFMAEEIKRSGKNIQFYTIDLFEGTDKEHDNELDVINKSLFNTYCKNIEPVKEYINTIKEDSKIAHKLFKDNSIKFVFIDGDHTFEGVLEDLKNWFPKIIKGGVIAGHDYIEKSCGVKKAVDSFFYTRVEINKASWIYKKY